MPCNVAAQTGCGAGLHCSVVFNGLSAEPRCVPIGSSATFASCTRVADGGADGCSAGELCSTDGCARACSLQQPSCPALTACLSDTDLEPLGVGTCVRTCDIVTQRRLLDNAQACGSATPATPNRGCYLAPSNIFVCAPAGNAGNIHRVNPNRTQINACAPGFQQFLSESTASPLTMVCVATCAPAATSTSTPANPGGVAPSTCAARGATTADCVFGWSLAVAPVPGGAGTTPSANTWGYCRDPQFYLYDHDQNGGTAPVPLPRCASLTTGDLDGNSQPDNRQWGCAPIP